MSLLKKIQKKLTTTLNPLKADLQRLNKTKKGLGDDAIRFVNKGTHETVLASLNHYASANMLDVGRTYGSGKKTHARRKLFIDLAKNKQDVICRYTQVLLACQKPFPSESPGSDKSLEAARIFFSEYFTELNQSRYGDDKIKPAKILDIDTAFKLVEKLGGDQADFIDITYNDNGSWEKITGEAYRKHANFQDFVQANTSTSLIGAQRMHAQGRSEFIHDLRKWKVVEQDEILDFVLKNAGDSAKVVREAALQALKAVSKDKIEAPAIELLQKGNVNLRAGMVDLLAQSGSKTAMQALKDHRKKEKTARVQATIDNLFSVKETITSLEFEDNQSAYTAVDGSRIEIPALRPIKTGKSVSFGAEEKAKLDKIIETENIKTKEKNKENKRLGYNYKLDLIPASYAAKIIKLFNQVDSLKTIKVSKDLSWFLSKLLGDKWTVSALKKQPENQSLKLCCKLLQGYTTSGTSYYSGYTFSKRISEYLAEEHGDLRNLELIDIQLELTHNFGGWRSKDIRAISKGDFLRTAIPEDSYYQGDPDFIPNHALWPYLAEQFNVFDEAFGLKPQNNEKLNKLGAIRYLQCLPKTPMRYYAPLLEIATGTTKAGRAEAREMLKDVDGVEERLIALLNDSRQAVRAGVAEWLGDLKAKSAVKALRARLKKEKSEIAKAAILTTLDRLGEDLSNFIGPKALLDEAEKGLKKAKFDKLEWLNLEHLSTFKYKTGRKVPAEVPKWWIYQAFKLKQPQGNKLFDIYLEQLKEEDAEAFSTWVFNSWINYDTAKPPIEDSNAYAKANLASHFKYYKDWNENYTEEKAFNDLVRFHQANYLNSGAATKGLLALAQKTPSAIAADAVRAYLKNHGSRTSQASSLLQLLANIGDPVALQVIIAAATRLKQKGVQKFAGTLLQQIASERNWTLDELADRTIPTAGLDDNGLLELPCNNGDKIYQVFLDDDLKLGIRNPDGKVVKALSSAKDDETKASKKQLSASRRELKQVVTMQSARLYESLCAERIWNKEDWQRDFRNHPIMRRITERVVWLALNDDEKVITSFRPTAEGDYTDAEDNDVTPEDYAFFKLAHGALLDDDSKANWLEHLSDYEVKAIFPQFERELISLDEEHADDTKINDKKGWVTDTFTLRGFASKLGYDRGETLDGGYFNEYRKTFNSAELVAVIEFSGNILPEENVPAALISLTFEKIAKNNRSQGACKLSEVPPVLLSECWNDYRQMASKGSFDKDWEGKMPWM